MTAFLTTTLAPAFIGEAYETSFAVAAGAAVATLASAPASGDTGLPPGLTVNAGGTITGTPTGAASTPNGSGVAVSGEGIYKFTLTNGAGANATQFSLALYASQSSQTEESNETLAQQAANRNLK